MATWIRLEDPDRDGRPLWFIPEPENRLILPLHLSVGEACGRFANKLNLEIVFWSVFAPEDPFGTSARFMYRATRQLTKGTRLWGPPRREFYAAHIWGKDAVRKAAAIKAAYLRGEEDPEKQFADQQRRCMGDPGRDTRIYGVFKDTTVGSRSVPALPASCSLPASRSLPASVVQPVIAAGSSVPAVGEDLAAAFLLPVEYYGVVIQPEPRLKLLMLKPDFMDPAFEPLASSDPPRANLARWWQAVGKLVRASYNKKPMPEELKLALKGRWRLYSSAAGVASDVVDLAAEAPAEDDTAEVHAPAKRSRVSVSRPRGVDTSSSSQGEADASHSRRALSRPRFIEDGGRGPGAALGGAESASDSIGALCGFTTEGLRLLKPLLQRLLDRL